MTTTPAPSISAFPLSGSTTGPFATGWKYNAAEDVHAYLELAGVRQPDLTQGADYTLSGASPTSNGGTVTLSAGLLPAGGWPAGARLVLYRRTAKRQALALPDTEGHKPRSTEQALDKLMRTAEEAADQLDLAVEGSVGEAGPTLPKAADRAGKLAVWSDDGSRLRTDRSLEDFDEDVDLVKVAQAKTAADAAAAISARISALLAAAAALQSQAIAAGYAADIVSQGNVPIYSTVLGMPALSIPEGINAVRINGYAAADDGGGWPLAVEVPLVLDDKPWNFVTNEGTRRWELRAEWVDLRMTGVQVGAGKGDQQPKVMDAINASVAIGCRQVAIPPAAAETGWIELASRISITHRIRFEGCGSEASNFYRLGDFIPVVIEPEGENWSQIGGFSIWGRQDDGDLRDGVFNTEDTSPGVIAYRQHLADDIRITRIGAPGWAGDPRYNEFMADVAPGKDYESVMHSAGQIAIGDTGRVASTTFCYGLIQSIRGPEGKQATNLNRSRITNIRCNYSYGDGVFTGWEVGTVDGTYRVNEGRRNINGVYVHIIDGTQLHSGRVLNWTRGFKSGYFIEIAEGNDCISAARVNDHYIWGHVKYLAGSQLYSFEHGPSANQTWMTTQHDNGTPYWDSGASTTCVVQQGQHIYTKTGSTDPALIVHGFYRMTGGLQIGTSTLKQFERGRNLSGLVWGNAGAALTPTTNVHVFQHEGTRADLGVHFVWTRSGSFTGALRLSNLPRGKLGEVSAIPGPYKIGSLRAETASGVQPIDAMLVAGDRIEFYLPTSNTPAAINELVADGDTLTIKGMMTYFLREET